MEFRGRNWGPRRKVSLRRRGHESYFMEHARIRRASSPRYYAIQLELKRGSYPRFNFARWIQGNCASLLTCTPTEPRYDSSIFEKLLLVVAVEEGSRGKRKGWSGII